MELHKHSESTELAKSKGAELAEEGPSMERAETRATHQQIVPRVDILEGPDEMHLAFDPPGVTEGDVDLRVERGDLSLSAEDKARGRVYRRAFSLPDTLDPGAVSAELAAGVLRVRLGKRSEAKPRRIHVRSVE